MSRADVQLDVLIVDDERLGRARLTSLLGDYVAIATIRQADSVGEAVNAIEASHPDVIFLDIQMPGESGFDLFERVAVRAHVVFVTAYDHYAVRAFELQALDYLLKPILPERLSKTIERILTARSPRPAAPEPEKICLNTASQRWFTTAREIIHIDAADDYTEVFLDDGSSHLVRVSMGAWESRLAAAGFVRVHRSSLINTHALLAVDKGLSEVTLRVGDARKNIRVSRRKLAGLLQLLEQAL